MSLPVLVFAGLLSWKDVKFFPRFPIKLLKWSCDFYFWSYLCDVLPLLILYIEPLCMKTSWSSHMAFLMCCWIWFWYLGNTGFVEWVWKCLFPINFVEYFEKHWCLFFKGLVEFNSESNYTWLFLLWDLLYYCFTLISILFIFAALFLGT
jgi:hypothetical protein